MIICADDYGLSDSINLAILDLVEKNKITHVSVLINLIDKNQSANLLKLHNKARIGLHLQVSFKNLFRLNELIKLQIEKFMEYFGFFPDFIDGHMHLHIYPFILDSLIRQLIKYPVRSSSFFVRSINIPNKIIKASPFQKRIYLYWLNALNFFAEIRWQKSGILTNSEIYGSFAGNLSLDQVLLLTKSPKANSLLFCHPGFVNDKYINRKDEYEILQSL